jgi:hypothetical protein
MVDTVADQARVSAPRGPSLGLPGCDRRVREPHRQAAALPPGGIIGGRIGGPVTLLRDGWRWSVLALNGEV